MARSAFGGGSQTSIYSSCHATCRVISVPGCQDVRSACQAVRTSVRKAHASSSDQQQRCMFETRCPVLFDVMSQSGGASHHSAPHLLQCVAGCHLEQCVSGCHLWQCVTGRQHCCHCNCIDLSSITYQEIIRDAQSESDHSALTTADSHSMEHHRVHPLRELCTVATSERDLCDVCAMPMECILLVADHSKLAGVGGRLVPDRCPQLVATCCVPGHTPLRLQPQVTPGTLRSISV